MTAAQKNRFEQESVRAKEKGEPFPISVFSGGKTNHVITKTQPEKGIMVGILTCTGETLHVYKI